MGFWQNPYKGDYGRVAAGAQYEYIRRQAFPGIGGAPLDRRQHRDDLASLVSILSIAAQVASRQTARSSHWRGSAPRQCSQVCCDG